MSYYLEYDIITTLTASEESFDFIPSSLVAQALLQRRVTVQLLKSLLN